MAYTNNYVEVLVDSGDYEAEIINADVRSTATGKQYLNLAFKLKHETNLTVYDKIWRDYNFPNDFNHKRVAQLLTALKIDDELADDFALIQAIKNKKLVVSVVKEYNDKMQKELNNVTKYSETQQVEVQVDEEDLPF